MNNQQAREVLLLYRPGVSDPNAPEFAEALACSRKDPDLERWFQEHCTFQSVLRDRFREISAPEGLKEQILSERPTLPAPLLKRNLVLIAAGVVLLLAIAGVALHFSRPREDTSFANFQSRMVRLVARAYPKMDLESSDPKQIRETLARKGGPADYLLPQGLGKAALTGCAVVEWQGKPVSMICFNSGKTTDPKEPDVFLFIMNSRSAPKAPPNQKPVFGVQSGLKTASWTLGDKTYLLAAETDEASLQNYF